MEKAKLRKRLIRLQEDKDNMKKFLNRNFLSDKEKNNFIKSFYVLEGRIRELQIIISEEVIDEDISN